MERGKIEVKDFGYDTLLGLFAGQPNFIRRYLVYRDIRERGYVIQPGPHDFRVFRRGHKPGTGKSRYLIRVLSERDLIDFDHLSRDVLTAINMRKQYLLAVVDDEDELTYYEVRVQDLTPIGEPATCSEPVQATLFGTYALAHLPPGTPLEEGWYGKRLDPERLLLRPVESIYLARRQCLTITRDGEPMTTEEFLDMAAEKDIEIREKEQVFSDLRDKGYIPRTGYKFGHHYRVYSEEDPFRDARPRHCARGFHTDERCLARSGSLTVSKKMLFACIYNTDIR